MSLSWWFCFTHAVTVKLRLNLTIILSDFRLFDSMLKCDLFYYWGLYFDDWAHLHTALTLSTDHMMQRGRLFPFSLTWLLYGTRKTHLLVYTVYKKSVWPLLFKWIFKRPSWNFPGEWQTNIGRHTETHTNIHMKDIQKAHTQTTQGTEFQTDPHFCAIPSHTNGPHATKVNNVQYSAHSEETMSTIPNKLLD